MTPPYDPAPGTVPVGGWTPWGTWDPAAGRPVPAVPAAPVAPPAGRSTLGPGGIAVVVAGLVVGMVLAAVVGALLLRGAADDAGTAAGEAIGEAVYGGGVTEDLGWYADPYAAGGLGPVEQSEPVPPGVLGPDPVLDGYAQQCFDGDLQSCDDLYIESPPLSDYEEYGLSCGGRVKAWSVPYCTELD